MVQLIHHPSYLSGRSKEDSFTSKNPHHSLLKLTSYLRRHPHVNIQYDAWDSV